MQAENQNNHSIDETQQQANKANTSNDY